VAQAASATPRRTGLTPSLKAGLERLLAPRNLAFIGGARAVSAFQICRGKGFAGRAFMVNPNLADVDGEPCYADLSALPIAPDAAFIAVSAEKSIETVATLARMGAGAAVCFASGFAETDATGAEREKRLLAAAGDLALIGPNCFGVINYVNHGSLWPLDYPVPELPPDIAIISQSGNVAIDLAQNRRSVAFSHVISLGNQAGVQIHDLIDYYVEEGRVRAIGIFLEGLHDVACFHDACLEALRRNVAIVVLKAGRSEVSAKIARSHTNSLSGSQELYGDLFRRLGISWVHSIPEMLEALRLHSVWKQGGRRIAFFSASGGEASMAADFAAAAGLVVPQPDAEATKELAALMPSFASVSNPLDVTTAFYGKNAELADLIAIAARCDIDKAILLLDPAKADGEVVPGLAPMMAGLIDAGARTGVEVAIGSMKPESIPETVQREMMSRGVLPLQGIDLGCLVVAGAADRAERQVQAHAIAPLAVAALRRGEDVLLSEWEAKQVLVRHRVGAPPGVVAHPSRAVEAAATLRYPLALKASSRALPHKTEAGGVALRLHNAEEVAAAAERIVRNVASHDPLVAIDEVLIEEMVEDAVAEFFVGVKRDEGFGLALVLGSGGILVELLKDVVTLLLPASRGDIEAAIRRTGAFRLMDGFRGRPKGDLAALIDTVVGIVRFAEAHADRLVELDINPLFVRPLGSGVVAADALLRWIEDEKHA
jgi:acyl-CoA synthetase (NDP forming)